MNLLKNKHIKLIQEASGKVTNDIFVEKPGVVITKVSSITNESKKIFDSMNIDLLRSESEQHAEFNSRLTYMSFKKDEDKIDSKQYNNNMVNEFKHLSIYNDEIITFLVAGVAIETELEFIAHTEATVARLTSSKTKAQFEPLYKIITFNQDEESIKNQKEIIKDYILLKERHIKKYHNYLKDASSMEIFNVNTIGSKAVSFTITMSLKNWHKTLIGRLSYQGVEIDMLETMEIIATQLQKKYPLLIKSVPEYYKMNNGKKYE
jgi:hypothetical protein